MKNTDPALVALVAAAVVVEAAALLLRTVLVHLLALLLTVAGWRATSSAPLARQQAPSAVAALIPLRCRPLQRQMRPSWRPCPFVSCGNSPAPLVAVPWPATAAGRSCWRCWHEQRTRNQDI